MATRDPRAETEKQFYAELRQACLIAIGLLNRHPAKGAGVRFKEFLAELEDVIGLNGKHWYPMELFTIARLAWGTKDSTEMLELVRDALNYTNDPEIIRKIKRGVEVWYSVVKDPPTDSSPPGSGTTLDTTSPAKTP